MVSLLEKPAPPLLRYHYTELQSFDLATLTWLLVECFNPGTKTSTANSSLSQLCAYIHSSFHLTSFSSGSLPVPFTPVNRNLALASPCFRSAFFVRGTSARGAHGAACFPFDSESVLRCFPHSFLGASLGLVVSCDAAKSRQSGKENGYRRFFFRRSGRMSPPIERRPGGP